MIVCVLSSEVLISANKVICQFHKLTSFPSSALQLHLPLNSPLAGSELTKEPFRWDQRLFALVLRLPGATTPDNEQLGSVPTDESAITQMCEVTGGLALPTLFQFICSVSITKRFILMLFLLRAIVLCANTEDVKPVSGISGPKGPKWCCHQF